MPMSPEQLREAGNWVVQLKVILKKGTAAGNRPENEHRSTKKAVRLLLSNLRTGVSTKPPDKDALKSSEEYDRFRKVVFNAVDLLIDDKTAKSKSGKTKLEALEKFQARLTEEFKAEAGKTNGLKDDWKYKIEEAISALKYEEMEKRFNAGDFPASEMLDVAVLAARPSIRGKVVKALDPEKLTGFQKNQWYQEVENGIREGTVKSEDLLGTEMGRKLFASKPELRGAALATLDPAKLDDLDLDAIFGREKHDVLTDALLSAAQMRKAPGSDEAPDPGAINPAMFTKLKKLFPPKKWNEKRRGLGPRVCQELWKAGHYDQVVELIDYGVDTSLAARVTGKVGTGAGVYSGFYQPIQHVVSKHLRDVDMLDRNDPALTDDRRWRAQGAKKIFAALKAKGTSQTLTDWDDVKKSEMIAEFKKNPGTIWGFEDVRMPFVQAAHDTPDGAQPLRMMELWEAVEPSLTPDAYAKLLDDPNTAADEFIDLGVKAIEKGLASTEAKDIAKYGEIRQNKDQFIANFKRDAKAFLLEFASQMPKAAFITAAYDDTGKVRRQKGDKGGEVDVAQSDVAGIQPGKFAGGLACKAGLYWAKAENKPVYYCLDGINMDDVTNYKKAKNKAIEDFIAAGGKTAGAKGHDEVITMVELREILKNWDKLKDTVKFVEKGKMLTGDELKNKVADWQKKMVKANTKAGRTPAPPRANFTFELNAIDPGLMARLADGKVGDMDARDIVKKFGYLLKVAKTRPQIVLMYVMSRCQVLTKYGLIPTELPQVAAALGTAKEDEIDGVSDQLRREIKRCHPKLQAPLEASLLSHPLVSAATS